jgi:hypothetical protein
MNKTPCPFLWLLSVLGILLPGHLAASVEYDAKLPQLASVGNAVCGVPRGWPFGRNGQRPFPTESSGVWNSRTPSGR